MPGTIIEGEEVLFCQSKAIHRVGLPNSAGSSLFGLFGLRPNRTKALFENSNRPLFGLCWFRTEQGRVLKSSVRFEFVRDVRKYIGKTLKVAITFHGITKILSF